MRATVFVRWAGGRGWATALLFNLGLKRCDALTRPGLCDS